jgi:GNAT superfamily N-acetyltransferase
MIRRATAADVGSILRLIKELATYEREPEAVVCTEADLLRDGFGDKPLFHVLLAEANEDGGSAIGFAFYFIQYSTWTGRPTLYLEDLFVAPEHRSRGLGKAFMARLAKEAVERGCGRFQWAVLDWNAPSIAFYESLGARIIKEWLTVRLDGEALKNLADTC